MLTFTSTILIAALSAASPVLAQPAELAQTAAETPQPKPATPDEIAKARSHADRIIQQAGASDLFDNITTKGFAEIRHKMSGMECGFDPDTRVARINLYSHPVRGDDVSCTSETAGLLKSIYATRFNPTPSLDQAYALYQREIVSVRTDVKPFEGEVAQVSVDKPVTPVKSGYFVFTDKDGSVVGKRGATVVSRLAVAVMDDWVFEQRISGPFDKALVVSMVGEISMWAMLEKIAAAKASPPTSTEPSPVTPEGSPQTP